MILFAVIFKHCESLGMCYVYIPVKVPFIQLCLLDPRLVICSPPLCLHVGMCKPGSRPLNEDFSLACDLAWIFCAALHW